MEEEDGKRGGRHLKRRCADTRRDATLRVGVRGCAVQCTAPHHGALCINAPLKGAVAQGAKGRLQGTTRGVTGR